MNDGAPAAKPALGDRSGSPRVRRADPTLEARPRGHSSDDPRPFGLSRAAARLVYAVFWTVLVFPWIRRQRRGPHWNRVRLCAALLGSGALGLAWLLSVLWPAWPGGLLLAAALWLGPATDPDRERIRQARYRAESFLNGGEFGGGELGAPPSIEIGTALYLLVRGKEVLLVPRKADDVAAVIDLGEVTGVSVDGAPYRPVFVPEAKDPPVREDVVDRSRLATLRLAVADGRTVDFVYRGAFARHLADATAHALDQARRSAHRVPGHSPEVFHIVGREDVSK